jgi:hypothetical protein
MVQGGSLVGDEHRMPEIVGQDQRAHVQVGRGRGCGREGAERGELLAVGARGEVVAQQEHADARVLDPAGLVEPGRAG